MFPKRIIELANIFPIGLTPIDVGTDHAYLLIELFNQNKIKHGIGVENKIGPLNNAKINIEKFNLVDAIKLVYADGLSFDFDERYNALIFAGMGALNVIQIISKDIKKLSNIKYIITDIHRNEEKLIPYFESLNFYIENEKTFIDKKIKYHVVVYKKGE